MWGRGWIDLVYIPSKRPKQCSSLSFLFIYVGTYSSSLFNWPLPITSIKSKRRIQRYYQDLLKGKECSKRTRKIVWIVFFSISISRLVLVSSCFTNYSLFSNRPKFPVDSPSSNNQLSIHFVPVQLPPNINCRQTPKFRELLNEVFSSASFL